MYNDFGYYIATDYTLIAGSNSDEKTKAVSIPITPKIYILYLALFPKNNNQGINYFKQLFMQMYPKAILQQ